MSIGIAPVMAVPPPTSFPAIAPAPRSQYGGFWIRVAASLVDSLILGAVLIPVSLAFLLPALRTMSEHDWEQGPPIAFIEAAFMLMLLSAAASWLYEAFLTSSEWQGTVGKRMLSLKVTDTAGNRISFARASGRFFAKILSRMIMNIGFIMVAFTERKQGLHDLVAGTLVKKA